MAPEYGYAGRILLVDLSSRRTTNLETEDYADRFVGGRGFGAKIYWDQVGPEVKAFDEENTLVFAVGPFAGLPALAGSRWDVCGKSPMLSPQHFSYGNLGGTWGAEMKFAGYDAIAVHGKLEKPAYLLLHDEGVEFKDASELWGKGAIETREILKGEMGDSVRVVTIGPGGENMAVMATLLADNDSSGSGGLGAVMGSKKLKAIVLAPTRKTRPKIADPDTFKQLVGYFRELRGSRKFPDLVGGLPISAKGGNTKNAPCFGCSIGCFRITYRAQDGREMKFMCHPPAFYVPRAHSFYGGENEAHFHANWLCNQYGLSTLAIDSMIYWLERCHAAGILTDESTGIPISRSGSLEFIDTLVSKISFRDGFGDLLAQGTFTAADQLGPQAKEQLGDIFSKTGDSLGLYTPRLYPATGIIYAMEPKMPMQLIHKLAWPVGWWLDWVRGTGPYAHVNNDVLRAIARRFYGSETFADFSTYEGMALAAKITQDREYAQSCLILCELLWPIMDVENTEDHLGDPTLESRFLSAVTGKEVDEEGLHRIGERVFNLQRAILVREGHRGRDHDSLPECWYTMPLVFDWINLECLVPGNGGEVISGAGSVVDREGFERMKDEYYELRQWDVDTGLQSKSKLEELGLRDVAQDLEQRGLIALSN